MIKQILSVAIPLFLSSALFAQDNVESLFSMSLEDLMQVEITGSTLTPELLRNVPSAVTVFTHEEIGLMGLDSLDELMNLVPGFQSYRSSVSSLDGPFTSRGRRIGNTASEVLIMVDGQRMDEPRSSGSAVILPKFPLSYIERVEFIRGPGAAVYGSNAMMGLINIITRTDANELSLGYGSFNRQKITFLASKQFGAFKVDWLSHFESDDGETYLVPNTFGPGRIETDDPRQRADFNLKVGWSDTLLNLQHYEFDVERFYEIGAISNDFNSRNGSFDAISLKHDFNWKNVNSSLWLSYKTTSFTLKGQSSPPGALATVSIPASSDALFVDAPFNDYSEKRALWHNSITLAGENSFQFGLELRQIKAPETIAKNNFDFGDLANNNYPLRYYGYLKPTTVIQLESKRDIIGVYAQYQYSLFDSTDLTFGLRYDNFSSIGSQVSPRLALVHELTSSQSIKVLYGEAFRAPAESELYLVNNPLVKGNENLMPESVQSAELIWLGQWENAGFALGYFENHFKNAIIQIVGGGTIRYENDSQEPSRGIELELSYEVADDLLLRATYTHLIEKPELSFKEASDIATFSANYHFNDWNLNFNILYNSEREMATRGSTSNRLILSDYWLLHGKLSFNVSNQWQVFVSGKNLLNEDYRSPASSAALTEGVPNRGRELLLGVEWQF